MNTSVTNLHLSLYAPLPFVAAECERPPTLHEIRYSIHCGTPWPTPSDTTQDLTGIRHHPRPARGVPTGTSIYTTDNTAQSPGGQQRSQGTVLLRLPLSPPPPPRDTRRIPESDPLVVPLARPSEGVGAYHASSLSTRASTGPSLTHHDATRASGA